MPIKKIPNPTFEDESHEELHMTDMKTILERTLADYLYENKMTCSSTFIPCPDRYHETAQDAMEEYADMVNREAQPAINAWLNQMKPTKTNAFTSVTDADELAGYGFMIERGAIKAYATNVVTVATTQSNDENGYQYKTIYPNIQQQQKSMLSTKRNTTRVLLDNLDIMAEIKRTQVYQDAEPYEQQILENLTKYSGKGFELGSEQNKKSIKKQFQEYYDKYEQPIRDIEQRKQHLQSRYPKKSNELKQTSKKPDTKQTPKRTKNKLPERHRPLPSLDEIKSREQHFQTIETTTQFENPYS